MLVSVTSSDEDEDARKPVRPGTRLGKPLRLLMIIYVATALMQPTLTDAIRYAGGAGHIGWPPTQLATLANTTAMASLTMFVSGSLIHSAFCSGGSLRRVLTATALDLISGCLLTTGLLILGGGIFVVIYSSTTMWTALWARCSGQRLSLGRWAGVILVSSGMVLSASGNFADASGDVVAAAHICFGIAASVAGTVLHAAMFVYAEIVIKQKGIDIMVLCASMGALEMLVLGTWNVGLLAVHGAQLYVPPLESGINASGRQIALLYGVLIVVNALHAWAFFNMLERVGAVSSAVMKGLQMLLVFSFSVIFFCRFQATQCFSYQKAASVTIVALGLLVYAHSVTTTSRTSDGASYVPPRIAAS